MSKLKWVFDNEPEVYARTHKFMLPGDYISMKMTGNISTTVSGLSEAMLWNFKSNEIAGFVLSYFGIDSSLVPEILPTFCDQGRLNLEAASQLGLKEGTAVTYRAGDQSNNALSLQVFEPGEIAATGGTSGVVYAVVNELIYDPKSRVNGFAHVNHTANDPRIGILLCINGAGSQYSWLKQQIAREGTSYEDMERMISNVPVNSEGLRIIPFGNGAERILQNRGLGSHIINLQFNRHRRAHLYRAALEGIAFSFVYGIEILKEMAIDAKVIRVGKDNLFQSAVFSNTISALTDCRIEVMETSGAIGAALGAGVGGGTYDCIKDAFQGMKPHHIYEPPNDNGLYCERDSLMLVNCVQR
jgi:xylulokinase